MAERTVRPYPRPADVQVGRYTVSCDFCSGNFQRVERLGDDEIEIWTAPDCIGTEHQTTYSTWFYFSVRGGVPGSTITLRIQGMNPQTKMFNNDMRPVFRQSDSHDTGTRNGWERVRESVTHGVVDNGERKMFWIKFKHKLHATSTAPVFFAFCPPFSYDELQTKLSSIDTALSTRTNVHYSRDLMAYSCDGRRLDLITLTSSSGANHQGVDEITSGLFPLGEPEGRGPTFPSKRTVFVSARVHPGETAASHMFEGFIDMLLRENDPRSRALLDQFVFKMVPMINPDGVSRGHYRTDHRGVNLNRWYHTPDPSVHPTVWAIKRYMSQLKSTGRLFMYIDLHAHATKRGCFAYANALPHYKEQVENMLWPMLVSINNPHFDFGGCNFNESNMSTKDKKGESKEGSGRVAIYRDTDLTHVYTVECNYCCGRVVNAKPSATNDDGRASPSENHRGQPPRFTREIFYDVGKAMAIASLDLVDGNPWSRIPNSNNKSLDEIRTHLRARLAAVPPYRGQIQEDRKLEKARLAAQAESASAGVGAGGGTGRKLVRRNSATNIALRGVTSKVNTGLGPKLTRGNSSTTTTTSNLGGGGKTKGASAPTVGTRLGRRASATQLTAGTAINAVLAGTAAANAPTPSPPGSNALQPSLPSPRAHSATTRRVSSSLRSLQAHSVGCNAPVGKAERDRKGVSSGVTVPEQMFGIGTSAGAGGGGGIATAQHSLRFPHQRLSTQTSADSGGHSAGGAAIRPRERQLQQSASVGGGDNVGMRAVPTTRGELLVRLQQAVNGPYAHVTQS